MVRHLGRWVGVCSALSLVLVIGCRTIVVAHTAEGDLVFTAAADNPMASYTLTGDTLSVHDPSVIRQGSTYYVFSSDVTGQSPNSFLSIRCSQDEVNWTPCGSVFTQIPAWVRQKVPGAMYLWAPDISYFGGLYHVYYAGSTAGSQLSVIGLATNTTLDATDPNYKWVDAGEVLESAPGDDFNAIDPNILIDPTGAIWLAYGSYWTGIKQIQIDPRTAAPAPDAAIVSLATRPNVVNDPIEGASIVHHGNFYYLFVSVDYCCNANPATDDYKEMVGRSARPQGPFVDTDGTPMMSGGGTVILQSEGVWNAPGGGTAYVDSQSGESMIVFHALNMTDNAMPYLWVKHIAWQNDWPVLQ
jgi:arabinan endo-1,5-alpha-L-arabinosidase